MGFYPTVDVLYSPRTVSPDSGVHKQQPTFPRGFDIMKCIVLWEYNPMQIKTPTPTVPPVPPCCTVASSSPRYKLHSSTPTGEKRVSGLIRQRSSSRLYGRGWLSREASLAGKIEVVGEQFLHLPIPRGSSFSKLRMQPVTYIFLRCHRIRGKSFLRSLAAISHGCWNETGYCHFGGLLAFGLVLCI